MSHPLESPDEFPVGDQFVLQDDPATRDASAPRGRGGGQGPWRDRRAYELHTALREMLSARHAGDVCLARLLRLMSRSAGYRAWGHTSLATYVMEELRQASPRRLQYLVAIDAAVAGRPLPHLGDAWRRGHLMTSQARELIRVATPDNEDEWLEIAARHSVRWLHREVQRALRDPAAAPLARANPAASARPDAMQAEAERSQESRKPGGVQAAAAGSESVAAGLSSSSEGVPREPAAMTGAGMERFRRETFSATEPVCAAWQVFLETSRRLAGYDMPVHDCVDDLLAEYASGCTWLPEPASDAASAAGIGPGQNEFPDEENAVRQRRHHERHVMEEAGLQLETLRRVGRKARLEVDPVQALQGQPEPDAQDLHRWIRWVLRVQQRVEWHQMRLLRVMAQGRLHLRLGFESFAHYMEEALDISARSAWSQVALARALERFPKVETALREGRVTALEAATVCRVARGDTQQDWLDRARSSTLQQLREDVAFVIETQEPSGLPPARPLPRGMVGCSEPAAVRPDMAVKKRGRGARPTPADGGVQSCAPRTSGTTATTIAHRAETWYAMFGADPAGAAASMLSPRGRRRPLGFVAPESVAVHWELSLRDCRERLRHLDRSSDPSAADCVSDSQCVAILVLNFLGQWAVPHMVRASLAMRVFIRDGWRCQVPRCRSRAQLNAHHIIFRSHEGPDRPWNLVAVCRRHHEALHSGAIRVRGRAPSRLRWEMGINGSSQVRERYDGGTRVACDPWWQAGASRRHVRAPDDWRSGCGSTG